MIRFVFMAALFGALGAGGASVDWQSSWDFVGERFDYVVNEWNAPGPVNVENFAYWKQCDSCYNLWRGDRTCCQECGVEQFTANVRARKIEQHGAAGWWRGYQMADGRLYIHADSIDWFSDQFIVGNDVYQKADAIIARNANLR